MIPGVGAQVFDYMGPVLPKSLHLTPLKPDEIRELAQHHAAKPYSKRTELNQWTQRPAKAIPMEGLAADLVRPSKIEVKYSILKKSVEIRESGQH